MRFPDIPHISLIGQLAKIKNRDLRRKFSISLISALSVLLLIFSVYAAAHYEFYYFNPDSVQSNFSLLTKGFGEFLKKAGLETSFQAFAQKSDFDRRIKEKQPDLVLVPSWYYERYGQSLGLTPLLSSLENGEPTYTKILLVRKDRPYTVEELEGKTVAMTTMGPETEELLSNNYFKEQHVNFSAMNIIITPKDADALYALALGQVDAALVGQSTLSLVGSANQRILSVTQELATSSPVPTPLLCTMSRSMDSVEKERLQRIFLDEGATGNLPNYMKMLQINGWRKAL